MSSNVASWEIPELKWRFTAGKIIELNILIYSIPVLSSLSLVPKMRSARPSILVGRCGLPMSHNNPKPYGSSRIFLGSGTGV